MKRSITTRVIKNARKKGCKVYTRKGWWCPNPLVYAWRRKYRSHNLIPKRPADTLWCHITVTRPVGIRRDMQLLHRIGMDRFDSGVSYNFAVDMTTGAIGLGQALDAAGTHTLNDKDIPDYTYNQNYVSLAIAFIGMPGMKPSKKAITSYARLIAALVEEKALTNKFDFNPHSMVAYKDCPTQNVRDVMPAIRGKADRILNFS